MSGEKNEEPKENEKQPEFFRETCLTWDHDTGEIYVDTTQRGIATKLKRLGANPEPSNKSLGPYRSFRTTEDVITVSFRKKTKKNMTPEHKEKLKKAAKKARAAKKVV